MKNLGEIESTILSDKKGKPQIKDLKQKKNSNVLFSEEKSEKISSVSIFNSNQKSNLDKSFITTEEQVFFFKKNILFFNKRGIFYLHIMKNCITKGLID